MADLEMISQAATFVSFVGGISAYLGTRSLLVWEKRNNIVNGQYAEEVLKSKRSDFYHKLFFLGEPSEVVSDYIKSEKE